MSRPGDAVPLARFTFFKGEALYLLPILGEGEPLDLLSVPVRLLRRLERIRREIVSDFPADPALTRRKKRGFSVCSLAGSRSRD